MSFFPLLNVPDAKGWTDLHNFPANNWELLDKKPRLIHASWASDGKWHSANLGILDAGESRRIHTDDLAGIVPAETTVFLSMDMRPLPIESDTLPKSDLPKVHLPAWRASVGISTASSQTSYQGEVDPFPHTGTLLTFGPFMQFDDDIQNYLLLLNLEKSPFERFSTLEAYTAQGKFLMQFTIRNNTLNAVDLNECGFTNDDLPLFMCRGMAGIPLYFSRTTDGAYLSLEHTHPPASMVLHGQRFEVQKRIKTRWLEKVAP